MENMMNSWHSINGREQHEDEASVWERNYIIELYSFNREVLTSSRCKPCSACLCDREGYLLLAFESVIKAACWSGELWMLHKYLHEPPVGRNGYKIHTPCSWVGKTFCALTKCTWKNMMLRTIRKSLKWMIGVMCKFRKCADLVLDTQAGTLMTVMASLKVLGNVGFLDARKIPYDPRVSFCRSWKRTRSRLWEGSPI